MVGTTMVGHIHIMIIELLMKLDVILKNVGCTVTKMLDHNTPHIVFLINQHTLARHAICVVYTLYLQNMLPYSAISSPQITGRNKIP